METSGFETSGLETSGFDTSGLKTTAPARPFVTTVPAGASIWSTFTVTRALGSVDVMKTGRDALERGASETSIVVSRASLRNDADPPVGWFAIVRR